MFERQEKEQSWDVGDEFAEKRRKDPKAMFLIQGGDCTEIEETFDCGVKKCSLGTLRK